MEATIYQQIIVRLQAQADYFEDNHLLPVAHIDWFKNQITEALAATSEANQGAVWPRPAVFVEFTPTQYSRNTGQKKEATGQVILHLVQDQLAINSEDDSGTQGDFISLLNYAEKLVNVLDGEKLTCGARLVHSGTDRDHTNSPLLHERITFRWSAVTR